MEHYLGIFVRAAFIENMALTFFGTRMLSLFPRRSLRPSVWVRGRGCAGDHCARQQPYL